MSFSREPRPYLFQHLSEESESTHNVLEYRKLLLLACTMRSCSPNFFVMILQIRDSLLGKTDCFTHVGHILAAPLHVFFHF